MSRAGTTLDLMPTWAVTVPAILAAVHEPLAPRQPAAPRATTPDGGRRAPTIATATAPAATATLVRVIGALMQDAEWRVTGGDRPVGLVVIIIEQPGSVPLRATQVMGTDTLAHVAGSAKAHRLTRGTVVQVEGNMLAPHPTGRSVELFGVTDIVERVPARSFRVLPHDDDDTQSGDRA